MCVSCKIKYFFPSIMQIKASKMAHNTILSIACYYLLLSSERTERERNVLFNGALNTFYLRLYGVRHMVKDHSKVREETCCCHIGYSFRLTARVLLYASSHRQDNTYHGLCYTSCGALAGTRNSSKGPPWRIDLTTHRTMSERSYHRATSRSLEYFLKIHTYA